MKVKSKVTGQIVDLSDDGAKKLIDAGIYEAAEETTVAPMTTESMPTRTKRAK